MDLKLGILISLSDLVTGYTDSMLPNLEIILPILLDFIKQSY
jgi:hypothetical protein